ncbi:hypothetical protein [Bradyrhizobium australiense]|uniref:Uncharacterized protein n=1 Tax=Bradyrhizobium australiense TaxID=2721161 RepID=A0A7Y4GW62_9BRAD|nr:hypothetical protein [Bradyrhizobium australiense]NOJ42844.1 hypothetical protein [Bradyrhizobium australiense]
MAFLKRELHRQVKGPEITELDFWSLVFDTDSKRLYVEHEWTYMDPRIRGAADYRTDAMDIAEYLTQGGQTAGHRELWRLLRVIFKEQFEPEEDDRGPPLSGQAPAQEIETASSRP